LTTLRRVYPAEEVSGMKDPNPPTLLRLKPSIAKARYHEALNLEGLDTVILDGALVSPLALRKSQCPPLAIARVRGKDPQEAVLFLFAPTSPALCFCQQGTALKENPEETPSSDYRTSRSGLDWCPANAQHPE
jgi:hypothetical protein